jgi:hypothetical protein
MKTIQKLTLGLLTVAAFSTSASAAAVVDINFAEGASYAGAITGGAKFVGTGNLAWTGSVTSTMEIASGTVKSANSAIPAAVIMNGGGLHMSDAFTKSLTMTGAGTLTLDVDSNVSATGPTSIILAGAGKPTLGVLAACGITSSVAQLQINATSRAAALVSVANAAILVNPSAALGAALTVSGTLDASAVGVTGANLGVLTVGGVLNIGGTVGTKML